MSKRLIPQRTTHYHALDLLLRPARMRLAAMLTEPDRPHAILRLSGRAHLLPESSSAHRVVADMRYSAAFWLPVGFCYFRPLGLEKSELFGRLTTFYSKEFCFAANHITTIDEPHAGAVVGYRLMEKSDVYAAERTFLNTDTLSKADLSLPEHYVLLERK